MSKFSQSAIERHYLQSLLPHPYAPVAPIPKTKDFYHPQSFIWNNPHRASHHMHKFYHAYNQNYQLHKAPLIAQQEELDRQHAEAERIHKLIAFRHKTREEFTEKQKNRELLEAKTRSKASTMKYTKTEQALLGLESHLTLPEPHRRHSKETQSERVLHIQDSYQDSLKKYDLKTQEISKLIQEQNDDYYRKIRSEFAARKKANDTTNSRFRSKVKKTIEAEP